MIATVFFTDAEIEMLVGAGRQYNLGCQALNAEAHAMGVLRWHIVPKHHYFCQMLLEIVTERINPRFQHCFCDEDFVGRVASICSCVHISSIAERSLQRYFATLHIIWHEIQITDPDLCVKGSVLFFCGLSTMRR